MSLTKATYSMVYGAPINVLDFGADPTGVSDSASAFNAAIASAPNQGSPNWQPWVVVIPAGKYKINSTIFVKNQQSGLLSAYGARINADFAGNVFQFGDTSGVNDNLWFTVEGLTVNQASTNAAANCVVAEHNYSCTFRDCFFSGGQYSFMLDGNGNLVQRCTFRSGITANVLAATTVNNEVNLFQECAFELGDNYGLDLQVNSGVGGFTTIDACYFEANATANIRVKNTQKFDIANCYFNLQNNAPGILLEGSVGPAYPEGYGTVKGNRILGSSTGTPNFIEEATATSVNVVYANNSVESDSCNLYAEAYSCVNQARLLHTVYIENADAFTITAPATIPTGWTVGGSGTTATVVASFSPYGSAAAISVPAATYIYQNISVPAGALIRVSVYGKTTSSGVASLQLFSTGLGGAYEVVSTSNTSATKLEIYLSSRTRSAASSFDLLLRNTSGSGTAEFCDIEIEDMTN